MHLVKATATILTSILLTGVSIPLTQVHANNNNPQTNVANSNSSEKLDGDNATTVGNTVYSISPETNSQIGVSLRAVKYKQGVSKVTQNGKYPALY